VIGSEPDRQASILSAAAFFCCSASIARKGAAAGFVADPVPQAMVITGIVVAFSASALAIALVLRLFQETGRVTPRPDASAGPPANGADT
jgi:multicomponent Na+:H+ antiporter subunit C